MNGESPQPSSWAGGWREVQGILENVTATEAVEVAVASMAWLNLDRVRGDTLTLARRCHV